MLQVSKCLIGLAVMVLQSCDITDNRRDLLCGNWESVEGKPAVLIPSPNVTNNHQERNARVLERAGGAKVLLEGSFTADDLYNLVSDLLADPTQLAQMADNMRAAGVSDAAERIADLVLELADRLSLVVDAVFVVVFAEVTSAWTTSPWLAYIPVPKIKPNNTDTTPTLNFRIVNSK